MLGRVLVEDGTRSGQSSSSWNEDVARIRDLVREDRTVTVRILADALSINKSSCHQILREDFSKQKLNARLVPHTHSLTIKRRCELQFVLICYTMRRTVPHSSAVSLPMMNHSISTATLRQRGKMPNGGQRVLQRK
jgi:hypothetical protein